HPGAERDRREHRQGCGEPDLAARDPEGPPEADLARDERGHAPGEDDRGPGIGWVPGMLDRLLEAGGHGDDGRDDAVVPVAEPDEGELWPAFRGRGVHRAFDRVLVAEVDPPER